MNRRRIPPPPFPARVAREAGTAWNLAKTFAQTLVFWGFFLGVLPAAIVWAERALGWRWAALEHTTVQIAGVVLFILAGTLGIGSSLYMATIGAGTPLPMDSARHLVIAGPYRYVRNPMAIAGLTQGAAVGLFAGSWAVIAYAACGCLVWNYVLRVWEEDDLLERFGADYAAYRAGVRCWWPRLRGYPRPAQRRTPPPVD